MGAETFSNPAIFTLHNLIHIGGYFRLTYAHAGPINPYFLRIHPELGASLSGQCRRIICGSRHITSTIARWSSVPTTATFFRSVRSRSTLDLLLSYLFKDCKCKFFELNIRIWLVIRWYLDLYWSCRVIGGIPIFKG